MNHFKRYAELKKQEAEIKAEMQELAEMILPALNGEARAETRYGLFSRVVRKNYKYSDKLMDREAEYKGIIKRAKEREERNGAEFTEQIGLRYQA